MSFSSTASLISTDLDNMLRGLYRDNADHAVTGTTSETDLASTSITGGVIGATGGIEIRAAGTSAGTAGTKTIRLYFGGTVIGAALTVGTTPANYWVLKAEITNTTASTQRITYRYTSFNTSTGAAVTDVGNYTTSSINTASSQTLKVTGQLGNSGDTLTQTVMELKVIQIQ